MINEFIAKVKRDGLSRTNRYVVSFTPPASALDDTISKKDIMLLCEQVTIPGVSYSTSQNRTFGEFRETPYEKLFDNATFSFYVDKQMHIKYVFDKWINSIQDPETRKFNYYNSYTSDLTVEVQDLNDRTRYKIELYECYPKSIGNIQLDYASKDIMKLSVTMQYKYWKSSVINPVIPTQKQLLHSNE